MVDRIDKLDRAEYWQVAEKSETHKDRDQGDEEGQPSRDGFTALGEKTDWQILLDKSKLWKRNIQILKDEIAKIIYRKVNLKTDPSLLRVDVELKGGEVINPAFISISRLSALKLKDYKDGDIIPLDSLVNDNILRVTTPANPEMFKEANKLPPPPEGKAAPVKEASPSARPDPLLGHEEVTVKGEGPTPSLADHLPQWVTRIDRRPEMLLIYGVGFVTLFLLVVGIIVMNQL